MAVPYTFGNATTSIPLSQLDTNFATAITIGNTAVYLGNTTTSFGNVTLTNVTISSGNATVTKVTTPTVDAGSGNALTLQSNSTTALYIDTSQNVGIGTSSPGGKLHVKGGNASTIIADNDGSQFTEVRLQSNGSSKGNWYWDSINSQMLFGSDVSFPLILKTNGTEKMRIDSSGNVGIGTSSPTGVAGTKLDVRGSITAGQATAGRVSLEQGDASGTGYVALWNSSVSTRFGYIGYATLAGSGSMNVFSENSTNALAFGTNGTERMRIDSSGTLMLGTTSVNNGKANFVRSDNGDCVIQPYANSTTFNNDIIRAVTTRTSGTTEFLFLACYYNTYSSVRAYIRADGNMYNVNGTYGTISDVKLKENIVDATPKLNDLLQLKVRNFNFINDELKTKQLGFVAQEVEQVFPNMVDVSREGNKTIKTSVLIPMLVKAIQELKAELDALKGTK